MEYSITVIIVSIRVNSKEFNNKIKVIKRKAYGFRDVRYISLKIIQAFAN